MISIPKKAFELSAQDGSPVTPSVGDEVTLDGFKGVVKSEDGDNLTVDLTEYQGQPVTYVDDPAEEKAKGADPMADDKAQREDLLSQLSKDSEG